MKKLLVSACMLLVFAAVHAARDSYDGWYMIKSRGKDIGYIRYSVKQGAYEGRDCWEIDRKSYFKFRFLIKKFEVSTTEKICLDMKGRLMYMKRVTNEEDNVSRTIVTPGKGIYNIKTDRGGESKSLVLRTGDFDYSTYGLEFALLMKDARFTGKKQLKVFDPDTMGILLGTVEEKGTEEMTYNGEPVKARVIERWFGKVSVTLHLAEDGTKLKESAADYDIYLSEEEKVRKKFNLTQP